MHHMAGARVDDGGGRRGAQSERTVDAHTATVLLDGERLDPAASQLPVVLELREKAENRFRRRRDDARRFDPHRPENAGARFSMKAVAPSAKSSDAASRS